jgi:prepilin-type processing-associated H-X9-DG protein/prepilin-type N-terminal cleavage/methylation domain-containing protein
MVFLAAASAKFWGLSAGQDYSATLIGHWTDGRADRVAFIAVGEMILGSWILSGFFARAAALTAVGAISAFSGVILTELEKPAPRPCGCFNPLIMPGANASARNVLQIALGRNVLLLGLAAAIWWPDRRKAWRDEAVLATSSMPRRATGFTMIEVLVVIGVVAILLGILVPATTRARQQAQRSLCSNNLKQLGSAFAAYAADNQGWIPRHGRYGRPRYVIWPAALARYSGGSKDLTWSDLSRLRVLQCPSHPTPGIPTAYVINAFASETKPTWRGSPPVRASQLRASARLPLLLETPDLFRTHVNLYDDIFFEPEHSLFSPGHLVDGATPRVDELRHAGRSNVLFADSHVETLSPGSLCLDSFDDGVRDRRWR